jgi:alkylated DNA repair dioxygenase AlkB
MAAFYGTQFSTSYRLLCYSFGGKQTHLLGVKRMVQVSTDDASRADSSPFKKAYARYRRKPEDPTCLNSNNLMDPSLLAEVFDFSRTDVDDSIVVNASRRSLSATVRAVRQRSLSEGDCHQDHHPHDTSCYNGPVYGLSEFPGFFYAPQALSKSLQLRLAHAALSTYCEPPHVTNLNTIPPTIESSLSSSEMDNSASATEATALRTYAIGCADAISPSMWELWKLEQRNVLQNGDDDKTSKRGDGSTRRKRSGARNVVTSSTNRNCLNRSSRKLAWATMGYHYDWSWRCYHKDAKSLMPNELQRLGRLFAHTAFLLLANDDKDNENEKQEAAADDHAIRKQQRPPFSFTASAAIVNFYNSKSSMGGHRDDLELALEKPVVSVSLGQSAILLLGGATKDDEPVVPILVRPGDVMIMAGQSRLNYHAMVRLVPNDMDAECGPPQSLPDHDKVVSVEDIFSGRHEGEPNEEEQERYSNDVSLDPATSSECEAVSQFLLHHRINLNLRQVYPD